MQNEACIKQGSEKESFRQQLIAARDTMQFYQDYVEFDDEERAAVCAILTAAGDHKMSPKAFVKAAEAVHVLDNTKSKVSSCGYAVEELNEREEAVNLFALASAYLTARAVVLGFKKSLVPKGWEILED